MNNQTTICRVGWCEKCLKEKRPHTGQRFLTLGSHGYHIYYVEHIPRLYGFTPHLYRLKKVIGQNVTFEYICCMENCGFEFEKNPSGIIEFFAIEEEFKRGILELHQWNALVKFKRDHDYYV